ncbi:MAG TPA: hypothetical protein PKD79_02360 [Candidatus Doudnabacteria bacterium]|nr:hypothetical protein [Candidatus Doudnabacteria bacterium]
MAKIILTETFKSVSQVAAKSFLEHFIFAKLYWEDVEIRVISFSHAIAKEKFSTVHYLTLLYEQEVIPEHANVDMWPEVLVS